MWPPRNATNVANDSFSRLVGGRTNPRPVAVMPPIPEQVKERPEYRKAWTEYERQLDEWRKSLEQKLSKMTQLESRLEALENAPEPEPAPVVVQQASSTSCCDALQSAVDALSAQLASESAARVNADNTLSNAISAVSVTANGNLDGGDADDVYGGTSGPDGGGA